MAEIDDLAAQARAAREDGRHLDAMDLWRAALLAAPDDPALALELKHDMKAALHYPDSDAQFRRAARHFGDTEWLAHYTALYAFHGSDLETLWARGQAMLAKMPDHAPLRAVLGDVARQRRDWTAAAAQFGTVLQLDPGHPEAAAKQADAHRYLRLSERLRERSEAGASYAIAVVNLDRNPERMAEIGRQFAAGAPPLRRIPGIEGSRLAAAAVQRLTGDAQAPRGTLGCFLSHAAAWQAVVDRGWDQCLVVEDDVIPLLDLPAQAGAFGLPPGYDLCFVNDRLEPRPATDDFTAHPLAEAIRRFPAEDNAPGGDGYFISQAGARTLLRWVADDGFGEDVDWRLIAYGLSPAEIDALPRHAHAWSVLDRLRHHVPRPERLKAYVLSPALIRTVGVSSDREDQNRLAEGRR